MELAENSLKQYLKSINFEISDELYSQIAK